ncbi:hypothetical protein Q1695_004213 [Nippostrongylus brasiliensis]|nr:hypothetical protein Q1695_004213 [Nippostrongylus brasiliensis]
MKSVVCLLLLATVGSCFKLPWGPNCKSGNYYTGNEHDLPKDIATAIQKNPKAKAMLQNGMAVVSQVTTAKGETFHVAHVENSDTGDYVRLKLSDNPATTEELDYKEYKKYTHCKAA